MWLRAKKNPSGPWKCGLHTVITKATCPMALQDPLSCLLGLLVAAIKDTITYLSPKRLGTILKVWALSLHRLGNSVGKDAGCLAED